MSGNPADRARIDRAISDHALLERSRKIGNCIRKAQRALQKENLTGEVIIADNGSTDGSIVIAERLGAKVVHVQARGYGNALRGASPLRPVNTSSWQTQTTATTSVTFRVSLSNCGKALIS